MPDRARAKDTTGEFMKRYADSVRQMVKNPSAFFAHRSQQRGYLEPTVYALMNILILKLFYALMLAPFTLGLSLILLIPMILYQLCMLGLTSVILFGIIRFFNDQNDFEGVYRSTAYAGTSSLLLLIPVPFFNMLLSAGGMAYLLYHALREAHGLNSQQAFITLTVPILLVLLLGMISTVVVLFLLFHAVFYVISLF